MNGKGGIAMQLEDYFEFEQFEKCDRIRIKGHRISIEDVLEPYNEGVSPEVILRDYYPTLTPEELYATLTYYHRNKATVDDYLRRTREFEEADYQEYLKKEPSPVIQRLRALKAQKQDQAQPMP
jgi:uncharacterized protein (DUF433 family)